MFYLVWLNLIKMIREILNEIIFWIHIMVIVFAIFLGVFVYLPFVILAIILHRVHVFAFNDCLLSKLQRKFGGLPKNMNFLQNATLKLFGKNINVKQSNYLDYLLALISITIALI